MSPTGLYFKQCLNPTSPTLVFLPGLCGNHTTWRKIWPAFENDFGILAVDPRGHGKSTLRKPPCTLEQYARDIKNLIDELKIKKIILVGHSMGGKAAYIFGARYPDRIEKLIVEDIGTGSSEFSPEDFVTYTAPLRHTYASRKEIMRVLSDTIPSRDMVAYFLYQVEQKPDGRFGVDFDIDCCHQFFMDAHAFDWSGIFEAIAAPTLIVRGEYSAVFSASEAETIVQRLPYGKLLTVADAGHIPHIEKPQAFVKILKKTIL